MQVRFTLPFNSTRDLGETYLNKQGVVLGVILNKTSDKTKISALGDCAIKCNISTDVSYLVPVWYDSNIHDFKAFTSEDSQNKVVGYIKPYQRDEEGNIISNYDISLREFLLIGF